MFINGPGLLAGVDRRSNARKTKSNGAFSLGKEAPATKASGTAPSQPIQDIDSILSIQEVQAEPDPRQQAFDRGGEILDILQEIKAGLLAGQVPEQRLQRLLHLIRNRVDPGDAELNDLIQEIELRAEVELAKLGRAEISRLG